MKIEAGLTIFLGKVFMKIEKGSILSLVIHIVSTIIAGMVIFPLLDFLIDLVFTHNRFIYSFQSYIIDPIVFGLLLGLVFWVLERKSVKKK